MKRYEASSWLDPRVVVAPSRIEGRGLLARTPIAAGEEVTVDYAQHTADLPWSMPCRCGSPLCRGTVTNEDWRRRDVQQRYAGHFSPFLNRRIAAAGGS